VTKHRNTSYQCRSFHTTGLIVLKSQLLQVETCTDRQTLGHMASFNSCNKIILGAF